MSNSVGTVAFIGGGEFSSSCGTFDAELLAASAADEVVVLPTAAAFEHHGRVLERAAEYFGTLNAKVRGIEILHRSDIDSTAVNAVSDAKFVYITDGSPLHLRSVLKDSDLYAAIESMYRSGGVVAASGAGATVLGDPMVDPRGGAYTVGLGLIENFAIFPYHGSAADHLRERSLDLLPKSATLVGLDEETALIRNPAGAWRVAGAGTATLYDGGKPVVAKAPSVVKKLKL